MPAEVARTSGAPLTQLTGELSAILGAAYAAFLKARLERRAGRRGKVHRRGLVTAFEIIAEMIEEAGGHDTDALWLMAISELDHDRGEIEADVLAHHGFVVIEHEWGLFLEWVGQVRSHDSQSRT
jgi:hypothetical protein